MLNGDAHHSLVWEVEPRIWPLLDCQRRVHRKSSSENRKQKNLSLSGLVRGPRRVRGSDGPRTAPRTPGSSRDLVVVWLKGNGNES